MIDKLIDGLVKIIDAGRSNIKSAVNNIKDNIMDTEIDYEYNDFILCSKFYVFRNKDNWYALLSKEPGLSGNIIYNSDYLLAKTRLDDGLDIKVNETIDINNRLFLTRKSFDRYDDLSYTFDRNNIKYELSYFDKNKIISEYIVDNKIFSKIDNYHSDLLYSLFPEMKEGIYKLPGFKNKFYLKIINCDK